MGVKLHVDLETLQLIQGPGQRSAVSSLRFKRGDSARLQVAFLENGITPVTIGDPALLEIQIGIKPRNQFDRSYLAHSAQWSMPAEGDDTPTYECALSFNTTGIDSTLGLDGETQLAEITLMGEITWREGSGEPTSTRTFLVVVENDVNRGTEGVPVSADPPYPAPQDLALRSEVLRHDAAQDLTEGAKARGRDNLGLDDWILTCTFSVSQIIDLQNAFSAWFDTQAIHIPRIDGLEDALAAKLNLDGPAQTVSSPLHFTESMTLSGTTISGAGEFFFADARPAVKGTTADVTANRIVIFDGTSGRVIKAHSPSAVANLAATPTVTQISTAFNDLLTKLRALGIVS